MRTVRTGLALAALLALAQLGAVAPAGAVAKKTPVEPLGVKKLIRYASCAVAMYYATTPSRAAAAWLLCAEIYATESY